ncbi:MAG: NlpC/P60 family protein [Actinomycetota bacterium]|nr:NlpC/P60 family protein [Actinomycetota bacterium]
MSSRRRQAFALPFALAAAALFAGSAGADPPSLAAKESQAESVLAQVREIDARLGRAVEAYNLANVKLDRIREDIRRNRAELALARSNLTRAQAALSSRVVAIYTADESDSTLEILLGAQSLDDFLNRIDAVNRVSDQDSRVIAEVRDFRADVIRRRAALRSARAEQERVVSAREAEKERIGAQLAQRRALLSTIRGEIARMRAAEAARQARLARQVQARMPVQPAAPNDSLGIAASSPEGATVAPPARHGGVVGIAMQFLGTPYRWGGSSPSTGFDCSGFVMYVFAQVGVSLPHSTYALWGMGVSVSRDQLAPGDLVFFNGLGHMGIYIGGGQMIHSPQTGDVVKISPIGSGWYASSYVGARRI